MTSGVTTFEQLRARQRHVCILGIGRNLPLPNTLTRFHRIRIAAESVGIPLRESTGRLFATMSVRAATHAPRVTNQCLSRQSATARTAAPAAARAAAPWWRRLVVPAAAKASPQHPAISSGRRLVEHCTAAPALVAARDSASATESSVAYHSRVHTTR